MEDVTIHAVEPLKESIYVRPTQVIYTQKNTKRKWDYIRVHDTVSILIFNVSKKCLVMVKQFRPAVYMHECHRKHDALKSSEQSATKSLPEISKEIPASTGVMYELCAGLADKWNKSIEETAVMEILEETGYKVSIESLELVAKYRSSVGTSGHLQTMFYVEVSDDMKVHEGGGLESEGEIIEPFHLPINEIEPFLNNNEIINRPNGVLFGLMWFLRKKLHLHQ